MTGPDRLRRAKNRCIAGTRNHEPQSHHKSHGQRGARPLKRISFVKHRDAQLKLASNVDESRPPQCVPISNVSTLPLHGTPFTAIARRSRGRMSRADACTLVFYAHDHYNRQQARSQHSAKMSRANNLSVMPTLVRPVMGSYE